MEGGRLSLYTFPLPRSSSPVSPLVCHGTFAAATSGHLYIAWLWWLVELMPVGLIAFSPKEKDCKQLQVPEYSKRQQTQELTLSV